MTCGFCEDRQLEDQSRPVSCPECGSLNEERAYMNDPRNTPDQIGEVARADTPSPDSVTSKSAHTPGQWESRIGEDGSFEVSTGDLGYVVICARAQWSFRAAESQANARLIAAAPDLLAALKELYGWTPEAALSSRYHEIRLNCVAAIRKATS